MERNMGHIDEGTLHAWLDGALPPDESARVESHVASCAACGEAAAEARGLVAGASRILTALDDVPGGVAPGGPQAGGPSSASRFRASTARRRWTGWPLRAAAAVIFVAAGSFAVTRQLNETHYEAKVVLPQAAMAPSAPPAPAPAADSLAAAQAPVARKKARHPATPKRDVAAPPPQEKVAAAAPAASVVASDNAARADSTPKPVTITGRVISATTGQPVSAATVIIVNEPAVAVATDTNGNYALPVPTSLTTDQPAKLTVRRIGFESRVDSVTIVQAPNDTVHHDVALKESRLALSEVVVTSAGARAAKSAAKAARAQPAPSPSPMAASPAPAATSLQGFMRQTPRVPSAPGCYAINAPGLPARIEIGEHLRVMPPDSAAFPTAYWRPVGTTSLRIVLGDTSGTMREIKAMILPQGLMGQVTRSDSTSVVTPFSAIWTATHCP